MKNINPEPPAWTAKFLELYGKIGIIAVAARGAGIHRKTVYDTRKKYPSFAEEMDQMKEDAADALEAEALRRARDGSDTLLIFLLKKMRPEFRDHYHVQHAGEIKSPPVRIDVEAFAHDLEARRHAEALTRRLAENRLIESGEPSTSE